VGDRDHIGIRRDVRRSFAKGELIALVNTELREVGLELRPTRRH